MRRAPRTTLLATACVAALLPITPAAGTSGAPGKKHHPRIWIVNSCGAESLKPAELPYACPGAGRYPVEDRDLAWRSYGHATAEATARFDVCLQESGLEPPAPPSTENLCHEADVTQQEIEKEQTLDFRGAWRFSHIVRCKARTGRAHGYRLFYGVTAVRYGPWPWRAWTIDTDMPLRYACPTL